MRFVVYGAGGIGGVLGARLFENGNDAFLIARGAHGETIQRDGLRVESPDGTTTVRVPAATHPSDLDWREDDVVLLAMKSQDTEPALVDLVPLVDHRIAVVSLQNGVANERMMLRHFHNVYGVCVMCPTTYLEPGVVQANSTPNTGILDIGRYPNGTDDTAIAIASAFSASTYVSEARPDIMRWKHQKLLMNLGNIIEAACGPSARAGELATRARAEGIAVLQAAGIDYASDEEDRERRGELLRMRPIDGQRRGGGSTWQSLARGATSLETDYLNGEIVLLGRLHGVATPVNAMLQHLAYELAASGAVPGSMDADDVLARLEMA
ncbi:MAG TPA: 2-dehydropantoate 2-reductase [Acidimicrobiales bacterium]|nr:2-dehydropantoate 2-reductase [Acidimicrobiales bacterium]